ncbi:HlyD family type I secretion periplasmic adaptor subunit [Salinarimonas sp.]|uniref:HlyD family type I secretion periplasmic adaptor subunit n=1 Tax=Salinarimonas sp. TaxID=2766526 RepID=UPI0032D91DFB
MDPVMAARPSSRIARSIRLHVFVGSLTAVLFGGGIVGWAGTTEIAGAVVGSGTLVVESDVKTVRHLTGGIVAEIRVREGQAVLRGDVLVKLDETVARASLGIVSKALVEREARRVRLLAERDGSPEIGFPSDLVRRAQDIGLDAAIGSEQRLFELRRRAREGLKAQLNERVVQLSEQIDGLTIQARAKTTEISLIDRELDGVRDLYAKQLVPLGRVVGLERERARLEGEYGQLVAGIAQTRGRIAEINLQLVQIDQDLSSEAAGDLRDLDAQIAELAEREVAAREELRRTEIRAPQSGTVHQLETRTVGGVIRPGEVVTRIVPSADELSIEIRVSPQDIEQVHLGQDAFLRFSAFSMRTTPELRGVVTRISPNLETDSRTGASFYVVRVALAEGQTDALGGVELRPGMPVEGFIRTSERNIAAYLTKPLGDYLARAFRTD